MEEKSKESNNTSKTNSSQNDAGKPSKRIEDDELYYNNSDGFIVFTEKFLLERGYCCGNGCLNCPYDYKAVTEPKRSQLLEKRKNRSADNSQ